MSQTPCLNAVVDGLIARDPVEITPDPAIRWASVAAMLREKGGECELLFIQRAKYEGDPWSGHMAFPGGRHDDGDKTLLSTALREVQEEMGVDLLAEGKFLGQLDDLQAVARGRRLSLCIRPFVYHVPADIAFTPNHEVGKYIWVPLSFLLQDSNLSPYPYIFEGQEMELPSYDFEGHIIWGLTYQMVRGFISRLAET